MSELFDNAVQSIRLGLEDYQADAPARTLSAVRNFYAGLLLLAKEVLVRAVPEADEEIVLAADYKPRPDGSGGIKFVPRGKTTINLDNIGARFKDFGLSIDDTALRELSHIRNDVEHRFPDKKRDLMKPVIAKAFPVAYSLFRQAGEDPRAVLEGTWTTMLEVNAVYEQDLKECCSTFDNIDWPSETWHRVTHFCPECRSDLVAQSNVENKSHQEIDAECRLCGLTINAEELIVNSIAIHVDNQDDDPPKTCPECGLSTYLAGNDCEDDTGCVWCECKLGRCVGCDEKLTPDDVGNRTDLCSYCDYKLAMHL